MNIIEFYDNLWLYEYDKMTHAEKWNQDQLEE